MIDEKKLVEEIESLQVVVTGLRACKGVLSEYAKHFKDSVIKTITEQPKVGEWIPIGQYPTEPCLLCFENSEMLIGYYDEWEDSYICGGYVISREPIAWQPLPEPYKENEGD